MTTTLRERVRARRLDRAVERGDLDAAITQLTEANRRRPDPEVDQRLLRLRNDAFHDLTHRAPQIQWPPHQSDRFADVDGVPEISADDLDVDAIRSGVFGRGALVVRGLLDAPQAELLSDGVDQAFGGYDRSMVGRRPRPVFRLG